MSHNHIYYVYTCILFSPCQIYIQGSSYLSVYLTVQVLLVLQVVVASHYSDT